jgi:hypothetical protein
MIFLIVVNTSCAQSLSEEEQIKVMLKEFYFKYNALWEDITSYETKEFEDKVFSLQQEYCSERLLREIKSYYDIYKMAHDLLINDFSTDKETLQNTLLIKKDSSKINSYIISYTIHIGFPSTPREEKNIIHVSITKEENLFKIDKVW